MASNGVLSSHAISIILEVSCTESIAYDVVIGFAITYVKQPNLVYSVFINV